MTKENRKEYIAVLLMDECCSGLHLERSTGPYVKILLLFAGSRNFKNGASGMFWVVAGIASEGTVEL